MKEEKETKKNSDTEVNEEIAENQIVKDDIEAMIRNINRGIRGK